MKAIQKGIEKYKHLPIALKAGLWFAVCNFLQKGISFITIPVFTRIMSTEQYGIYNVYSSWYSIITIFATLNLSYFVFNKGMVKYENDRNTFHVSLQSLSAVLTILLLFIYLLFSSVLNHLVDLTTTMMICMFLQILFEPPILYWTARNRFEYKYRSAVFVTIAISLLNPIVGIVLVKQNNSESAALVRAISVTIVTVCFGLIILIGVAKRSRTLFSAKYWKYALAFNLPLIPHFLSQTILNQSDRIMIKHFCGASDAAVYSVAYSVGMAFMILSQAIQQSYLPWLYQRLSKKNYTNISKTSSAFLLLMAALNIVVIAFTPEIIKVVGTDDYLPAIWVMPSICGSVYFIFLQNLFANYEYYYEKTRLIAVASIGVALTNLVLNYIFIPVYGFVAAGYTTLFCYVLHAIVHYFVMVYVCHNRGLRISNLFDVKFMLMISVLFIVGVIVMMVLYEHSLFRYAIIIVILSTLVFNRRKVLNVISGLRNKSEN